MTFNVNQAKSIFQSTTFWGSIISLFAVAAPTIYTKLFGSASQATVANDILLGIGFIVTVYGRFTAKQPVTLTGSPTSGISGTKG
jgi:uncharacterized membrane protein YwaF